jgi:hypothetical protein
MTLKEFIDNTFNGFKANNEGYSVKKMVSAFIVVNMIAFTWYKTDKDTFLMSLTAWLAFVTSLIVTGAVEKNITAVNETKQINNQPNNSTSTRDTKDETTTITNEQGA